MSRILHAKNGFLDLSIEDIGVWTIPRRVQLNAEVDEMAHEVEHHHMGRQIANVCKLENSELLDVAYDSLYLNTNA